MRAVVRKRSDPSLPNRADSSIGGQLMRWLSFQPSAHPRRNTPWIAAIYISRYPDAIWQYSTGIVTPAVAVN